LYTDARIINEKLVCGINKGLIDFYQLYSNGVEHKAILLFQINAHFMDITRFFTKGNFIIKNLNTILFKYHRWLNTYDIQRFYTQSFSFECINNAHVYQF
jgi:hypothetical protein